MARSSMTAVARWAGTVCAGAVLAVAAGLGAGAPAGAGTAARGAAPGDAVSAISPAAASCPQAKRQAVTQALAVSNVRAEIVIIVDVSYSMESNNLYRTVRKLVPALMKTLAKKDPQDLVAVITLGTRQKTRVVVYPGQPSRHTWVPPTAPNSEWSDFGLAFHEAIGLFSDPPPNTDPQVRDLLLLSDGQFSDSSQDDPTYGGQAPAVFARKGWQDLRTAAASLRPQVTGFEVPLTSRKGLQASQDQAMADVFHYVPALQYSSGLATNPAPVIQGVLTATTENVQNTKITKAVLGDSRAGVRATWSEVPGSRGKPIDLSNPGHADAMVTVKAGTRRVPLCLSRISVTSAGLPVRMRGANLPASVELAPGASKTWHVRLTWPRDSSTEWLGPDTVRGHLVLGAAISSPYRSVISPAYPGFSYGRVVGASPVVTASLPALLTAAILLAIIVASLVLLALLVLWRTWLDGELVLATGDEPGATATGTAGHPAIGLWGPRRSHRVDELLGKPARLIVWGSLLHRAMKIRMKIDGHQWSNVPVWLPRGGMRHNIAGVAVQHRRRRSGKRFRWNRRKGPDSPRQ